MKLVARFTLVLVAALAAVAVTIAYLRFRADRREIQDDLAHDHRMIGRVLQEAIETWADDGGAGAGPRELAALLDRADDDTGGVIHFAWVPGGDPRAAQAREGHDFVSRFPIRRHGAVIGTLVARESLRQVDQAARTNLRASLVWIGVTAIVGLIAALALGSALVGRPVAALVDEARRIGRGEPARASRLPHRDELGVLARELEAAAVALEASRAHTAAEAAARLAAVEQLRRSERLATVGTLSAGVAHELGTPMAVVAGHAQMIAGGEVTGDAALASARVIDREVGRMSRIVRQLLDFARRKGPAGTTAAPAAVAARCVALLAPLAERAGVRCVVVDGAAPLHARIDEDALQQVLTNVVLNAIQAVPRGGEVEVAVTRGAGDGAAPEVRIEVRDTGPGIDPAVLPHVFEPFVTTKPVGEGTGLGLAVVHGIVTDHGGRVVIDTGAHGTRFSIYLPEAT